MESLLSILRRFNKRYANISKQSEEYTFLGDICLMLSWKYPCYSLTNFTILNLFLWLAARSQFQALGLVSTLLLLKFLYQNTLGLQMNTKQFSSCCDKIKNNFNTFISSFSHYRNENPSEFCVVMSFFFITLAYVSNLFSGVTLCFLVLWVSFLAPLIYSKMPPHMKERFKVFFTFGELFKVDITEEDLLPKVDDSADLDWDKTGDSLNSLISGISSMPSYDNQEIMEEDLMPFNSNQNSKPFLLNTEFSSDSESELRDIQLKDFHFSRENSSEEEGAFEEGLHFVESANLPNNESEGLVQNIVNYVASTKNFQLPIFSRNAASSKPNTETKSNFREGSSSEDDFEIVDADDLKK